MLINLIEPLHNPTIVQFAYSPIGCVILCVATLLLIKLLMDLYAIAISNAQSFCSGDVDQNDAVDFLQTDDPVWIIGKKYTTLHELEEIRSDFRSKIWITYRKGFAPIGGIGPSSDTGWGCMLRCGQMVLAQALIHKHLGRDWRWRINESLASDLQYREILKLFQEKKDSIYSIHQIAQMGAAEGKSIGEWFGPNTIAQVLKKLSYFDKCNKIAVHVSLDNMVVIDDIRTLCLENAKVQESSSSSTNWKSLLLFIPLRLGLSEINPIYFKSLQKTFTFPQSLGIIGGRPNHALYFVGTVGNELIYLDPHTTQAVIDVDDPESDDSSYHCEKALRMDISQLDPSIALCFFCDSEADFKSWCKMAKKILILSEKQPLFELAKERPAHWPQLNQEDQTCSTPNAVGAEAFTLLEDIKSTSDDEFELLG